MRLYNLKTYFQNIISDGSVNPNCDTFTIVNRGTDVVTLEVNETSTELNSGESLGFEGIGAHINEEFTFTFAGEVGKTKNVLLIKGIEDSKLISS